MAEQHLSTYWTVGLGVATSLVGLATILLIVILRTAKKVERSTSAALEVIRRIREQALDSKVEEANQATQRLNVAAESFLAHADAAPAKQGTSPRNGKPE